MRHNGLRYPLVGGTRSRRFDGTRLKPRKLFENAQTPTSRVHAVLGGDFGIRKNLDGLRCAQLINDRHLIGVGVPAVDMLGQAGGTL